MKYKYANGTIGAAHTVIHAGVAYPPRSLNRNQQESHADWIARLAIIGVRPVRIMLPDVDINQYIYGEPVESDDNGVLVISYPDPIAKIPVWSTTSRERMYITPGALVPPDYTEMEPPDLWGKWDGAAWIVDVEAQAASVRGIRDGLIAECDWTQLPDAPLTEAQKLAWTAYRQALRDVPQQPDFPADVTWPDKPQVL